ncbi:MAG: response regulator transcription factor [Saprospiraceae bacterium]
MKVLICEDEEILLTAIEFRLRKQGYELALAQDGMAALEQIRHELPDLLVVDVKTPKLSGLELIKYIRSELKSSIPIIVISSLDQDNVVLEAFQLGATDFIAKPFKPAELVLRIRKILATNSEEPVS